MARRNDPRSPRTASQQEAELHRGMDRSGNGIDTDARDDTKSAGHMALPLSSATLGRYSHSDRDGDEDEEDYDNDEARFSEDEDLDESFCTAWAYIHYIYFLGRFYAQAIVTTPEKGKKVATCRAKLIRQRRIIDNFYDDMEEPTEWI